MDLDAFRWLLTDDGQQLLERAAALAGTDELHAQETLRRTASAEHVAAALTQVGLRERATAKFGADALRMYFTPDGLEQATRARVAAHRAARLVAFETRTLIDLGLWDRRRPAGRQPGRADLRGRGPRPAPGGRGRGEPRGARPPRRGRGRRRHARISPFDVAFADPARRSDRGRTFRVDDWTPPWTFVETLFARDACVKVAPGIPHSLVPDGVEAEWVSDQGEVKEAALWSGSLASAERRATVIGESGLATLTEADDPGAGVREVGAFIYEPDGAVIRAGLVTAVAAGVDGYLVDEHIAYVTSDGSFRTPFARGYEVLARLPYREKPLRAALRERQVGRLTIKKRGVDIVPEELRRRLALTGDEEATIILTRVNGKGTALLVNPF